MILLFLAFLAALALAAFSGGSETAFSSAGRFAAMGRAREGSHSAALALKFMSRPESYLTTTLVGTNIGTVLCSSISTTLAARAGDPLVETLAAAATALLLLVFAESVPKQVAFAFRDGLVDRAALPLSILRVLVFPVSSVSGLFTRIVSGRAPSPRYFESREEVRSYLHGEGDEAGREAARVLNLGSAVAGDHMRGLEEFPCITPDASREVVLDLVRSTGAGFLLVLEPEDRVLRGCLKVSSVLRHEGEWNLSAMTGGMPYFDRRTVLGRVLYELRRAGAPAGAIIGGSGQPEGIIDPGSIVDTVLGPVRCSRVMRTGSLELG